MTSTEVTNAFKLFERLDSANGIVERRQALVSFIGAARSERERNLMLALLSGASLRRPLSSTRLKELACRCFDIPRWLFDECYDQVGDLAETITLLRAGQQAGDSTHDEHETSLVGVYERINELARAKQITDLESYLAQLWSHTHSKTELLLINKLFTGGFRVGVSRGLVYQALGEALGIDHAVIAHRLAGKLTVDTPVVAVARGASNNQRPASESRPPTALSLSPYPFFLAQSLSAVPQSSIEEWSIEWKWDGIRAQFVKRGEMSALWSRGEELITEQFPEIITYLSARLENGTVLDGEIIAVDCDGRPLHFSNLQTRLNRTRVSKALLQSTPCQFMAYDLLEHRGEDIRTLPYSERRELLASLAQATNLAVSPRLTPSSWEVAGKLRDSIRRNVKNSPPTEDDSLGPNTPEIPSCVEGLMLKNLTSPYEVGRRGSSWLKWKVDPLSVDAVLLYAQRGHGRRAGLFSDYTFGVWTAPAGARDRSLVTFTKAYSGLTDDELKRVTHYVLKNTLERHGPVHTVPPELVFEIAFDSIAPSARHKAGVAVRFPRIKRQRVDKPATEADSIETIRSLLPKQRAKPFTERE